MDSGPARILRAMAERRIPAMTFFRDREQHPFEWTGRESKLGRWAPTVQLVGMYREGTLWFAIRSVEIHKIQPGFEEAEPSTRATGMMRTRLSTRRGNWDASSRRHASPAWFRAGFYESPEGVHTVRGNASKTKPAKFIVFFIKTEAAPILTPVHSLRTRAMYFTVKSFLLKQCSLRGGTY